MKYIDFKELHGKTITETIEGDYGDDDCVILKTSDGSLYMIESGSNYGDGLLSLLQIDEAPKGFKED